MNRSLEERIENALAEDIDALKKRIESVETNLKGVQDKLKSLTQEDIPRVMRVVIAVLTILLWCLLVIFGIASVWAPTWQSRFIDSVTKVLLPLFNATIAASLTYVFGKPVVKSVARWLSK